MIKVHHLNNSRSQRVLWLLEEIGLDYEIVPYKRTETNQAPAELKEIHPLGKSPVITDGDLVLAESGAIVDYFVRTYKRDFMPDEASADFLRYTYWMHYAEGSAMPWLLIKLFAGLLGEAGAALNPIIDAQIKNQLDFIDGELGDGPYFLGNRLSGADFMMVFPLEGAAKRGPLKEYPGLMAYLERIHALPAYKRGLERGGPYELLGDD